jgi:transitional endoplasmic reticulum ATPase
MGKDLNDLGVVTNVAEIVHHGEKLILPEGLAIPAAIDLLMRRAEYLEAVVSINEKFDVFPFDGAYGLSQVIISRYGWAEGKSQKNMFGETKPQVYKIASSHNTKVDVPWGKFELPNIDGMLMTGSDKGPAGRAVFTLSAEVKRKDEPTIRALFDELRAYLKEHSLYRGKAIKIRFRDDNGNPVSMPEPEFINVEGVHRDNLLLNEDLMNSINANLFTPITRVKDCLANGIKIKRGILLGGPYGTGKTLAATVAASLAQESGITYVYTPRANELGDAIAFAKQYQSPACVVFCEDIDRDVTGVRTVKMDDILNILDGIDTKSENIITVLTTNHLDNVNQAMLRPGRLDAIIDVVTPDAPTAIRLVRHYGGEAIRDDEDLSLVGEALQGQIPAVIEETVKRAKLFQLTLLESGAAVTDISAEAIRQAAVTMTTQIELLAGEAKVVTPQLEQAFKVVVGTEVERVLKVVSSNEEAEAG